MVTFQWLNFAHYRYVKKFYLFLWNSILKTKLVNGQVSWFNKININVEVFFLTTTTVSVKGYPKKQTSRVIMDTFKGQDNDEITKFWAKNSCEIVIILHNLANKFQPLDIVRQVSARPPNLLFLPNTILGFWQIQFLVSDKYSSWFLANTILGFWLIQFLVSD